MAQVFVSESVSYINYIVPNINSKHSTTCTHMHMRVETHSFKIVFWYNKYCSISTTKQHR